MTYKEYKKMKVGAPCVIIQTGEEGKVTEIAYGCDRLEVHAKRHGLGIVSQWFNYTEIASIW